MERGDVPLIGHIWLLAGFDADTIEGLTTPELLTPEGQTPLLLIPDSATPAQIDAAFHEAVSRLFFRRYGPVTMLRAIRAWDAIVEQVGEGAGAAD
jgi:hypothetical protein